MRGFLFVALALLALGLLDALDRGDPPLLVAGEAAAMPKMVLAPMPAAAPAVALYSTAMPPQRYRRNASFQIELMDESAIGKACGDAGFIACHIPATPWRGDRVVISNPCLFDGEYARRLCHELGHVNGWPRMHGP